MKRLTTIVIVGGAILGGITLYNVYGDRGAVSYTPESVTPTEVIREVNPLDEQIKERERELEEKYNKIRSLEARRDVLVAENERLEAEITEVTKELASFMTATTSRK